MVSTRQSRFTSAGPYMYKKRIVGYSVVHFGNRNYNSGLRKRRGICLSHVAVHAVGFFNQLLCGRPALTQCLIYSSLLFVPTLEECIISSAVTKTLAFTESCINKAPVTQEQNGSQHAYYTVTFKYYLLYDTVITFS